MLSRQSLKVALTLTLTSIAILAFAQRPPMRRHTANRTQPVKLVPANQNPPAENAHRFDESSAYRIVRSNGMPDHLVGRFPNHGNPHRIREQSYQFRIPATPRAQSEPTPLHQGNHRGPPNLPFGVAVNGVLFDPGTAEYWQGDRRAGWNYEALGGAVPLGLDGNHAHVQPTGAYHYHGLPTRLLKQLGCSSERHSPLVGWAADGFPVYALYGFADPNDPNSKIIELTTSFRLKKGNRPAGRNGPGGTYDGTFIQDYQFVADAGTLDVCNGRFCKTPDFPQGTYAYFLTNQWPVIPRAFRGKPVNLRGEPRPRR